MIWIFFEFYLSTDIDNIISPDGTKKTILVLQRLHILDLPELRLKFPCLLFVGDRLNKAVLPVLFQIQIIADAFVAGICHNVTVFCLFQFGKLLYKLVEQFFYRLFYLSAPEPGKR